MPKNKIQKPKTLRELLSLSFTGWFRTHSILLTSSAPLVNFLYPVFLKKYLESEEFSNNLLKKYNSRGNNEFVNLNDMKEEILKECLYFYVKYAVGGSRQLDTIKKDCLDIWKNFNSAAQADFSQKTVEEVVFLSLVENAIEDFERNTTYVAARDFREVRDRDGVNHHPGYCASLFQVATNFSDDVTRTRISILKGMLEAHHLTVADKVEFIFKEINDQMSCMNKHLKDAFIRHYVLVPGKKEQAQEQNNVDALESSINSPLKA